jgi:mitogen-activated protein kinase organizer 1
LFNPAKAAAFTATTEPQSRPAGLVQTYAGHAHEVLDIAVSSDNARFVSVGGDKHVLLWDVSSARVLRRYEGHSGRINTCAWGGDGREEGVIISGMFV